MLTLIECGIIFTLKRIDLFECENSLTKLRQAHPLYTSLKVYKNQLWYVLK